MTEALVFYFFSAVLICSSVAVVAAKNPVHSVLYLVLCFFNAAWLFLLLGAEFVAFILLIVYVGAVAVLFLFVVMMLDVDFEGMRRGMRKALPVGLVVGGVLLAQLLAIACAARIDPGMLPQATGAEIDNTRALGRVLYTQYMYPFQVAGLILLVAMVGAITLTLRKRKDARKQNAGAQIDRRPQDVIELVKIESGKGLP